MPRGPDKQHSDAISGYRDYVALSNRLMERLILNIRQRACVESGVYEPSRGSPIGITRLAETDFSIPSSHH